MLTETQRRGGISKIQKFKNLTSGETVERTSYLEVYGMYVVITYYARRLLVNIVPAAKAKCVKFIFV